MLLYETDRDSWGATVSIFQTVSILQIACFMGRGASNHNGVECGSFALSFNIPSGPLTMSCRARDVTSLRVSHSLSPDSLSREISEDSRYSRLDLTPVNTSLRLFYSTEYAVPP